MTQTGVGHQSRPLGSLPDSGRLFNPVPRLEEPVHLRRDSPMRDTPDVSADIDHRLNITEATSDEEEEEEDEEEEEEEEDSVEDIDSSVADDDELETKPRGLPISELSTGLCYDERMRYHAEVSATTGENVHPEDPRRIYYIFKELSEAGLVKDSRFKNTDLIVKNPLFRIDAREATKEECCLVHTDAHYEFVKHTADLNDEQLIDLSEDIHMDSIYFNALSYFAAKLSAGAAIDTCRAVVERKVKNAIAVIRPPGHHAEVQSTMGFCLFNNVCVASRVCQRDFGQGCRKILILDWDVHHGNGCQKAFYQDPNILYVSIHVHMDGRFYPSGQDGAMDKVGEGVGEGKNVNIPWPTKGMGDGDYMYAFQQVVMPIATEFDPDLVIVAAGFDAAAGDELGGCFVTPACYAHMTHMLMSLANGKVAVCLEGGYNFAAISKSALAVTRTLMGEPPDRIMATQATKMAIDTVEQVKYVQSKYWQSINPKGPEGETPTGERLHDILRQYQAHQLYENHKLTELHVFRDSISKSYQKQILASRDYYDQKYLLVIFHDSPDLLVPGGQTSTLQRPHESIVLDATQSYISTALSHSFGVISVNIPEHITLPSHLASRLPPGEAAKARSYANPSEPSLLEVPYAGTLDLARQDSARLARYLWENYIEPFSFPAESIILMGCGHAFHAVARLMSDLPGEAVYQSPMRERENALSVSAAANSFSGTTTGMLAGVVGFISTNPVRPVQNNANPWVSEWYKRNSLVFVAEGHQIFRKQGSGGDGSKKMSKKYGEIVKVGGGLLPAIMEREGVRGMCWEWILKKVGAGEEKTGDTTEEEEEEEDGEGAVKLEEGDEGRGAGVGNSSADGLGGAGGSVEGNDDVVMTTEK